MKKSCGLAFALSLVVVASFTSCAGSLAAKPTGTYTYGSETGERIRARYYALSDGSLDFVKITLPDGKEYTLPNVMSASGAKYSDDALYIWWTKGENAFLETRSEDGDWVPVYRECKIIEEK